MPELPEVETIRRQLQKTLVGRGVKSVKVYTHKMVKVGPGKISNIKKGTPKQSQNFSAALVGKTITSVERRAKFLIIHLSKNTNLMIHLRMSGQMIVVEKKNLETGIKLSLAKTAIEEKLPTKHSHVEFTFTDNSKLFYNDTRQFGHIRLATTEEMHEVIQAQQLGPEPLLLSFPDFQKIVVRYKNKKAKDFLLDQSVIAGIGNIYADESLFASKIHPQRKIGTVKAEQLKKLFTAIQKILLQAIKSGGSSIEHFLMTNGTAGKFSHQHLVYGKGGKPCPNCKRPLTAQKIGSRTATFCAYCQK